MTGDRLPRNLRRRAARRCWCGRPVGPLSDCQCCCSEHDTDVGATARALLAAMDRHPAGKATTNGGPTVREYLASKGEL